MLEQSVPEGLHPVEKTHAGAVLEELQPMGGTHVGAEETVGSKWHFGGLLVGVRAFFLFCTATTSPCLIQETKLSKKLPKNTFSEHISWAKKAPCYLKFWNLLQGE